MLAWISLVIVLFAFSRNLEPFYLLGVQTILEGLDDLNEYDIGLN